MDTHIETERKYIVRSGLDVSLLEKDGWERIRLTQAYLDTQKDRCMRIRMGEKKDSVYYEMTVKEATSDNASRKETNIAISAYMFEVLKDKCQNVIEKTRWEKRFCDCVVSFDIYEGFLFGLTVMETEFDGEVSENDAREICGIKELVLTDVTDSYRFSNAFLSHIHILKDSQDNILFEENGRVFTLDEYALLK